MLSVVVYTFNASTQEEEAGGSLWVQIWAWVWSVCTARPYLKQTMQKMDFKKPFRGQMLVAHTLSPVFRQTNKQKHTKKSHSLCETENFEQGNINIFMEEYLASSQQGLDSC